MEATLIFPHQLFENHPSLKKGRRVILLEESLFFTLFKFHKRKLAYHRASMKFYQDFLVSAGYEVEYVESLLQASDCRILIKRLASEGVLSLFTADFCDDWLGRRVRNKAKELGINLVVANSPMFLNSCAELDQFFKNVKTLHQTDFYRHERKKRQILLVDGKPVGGKWTYDNENRKKFPKNQKVLPLKWPKLDQFWPEAIAYVEKNYGKNPGELKQFSHAYNYPVTYDSAREWLDLFLRERFAEFGDYEDAIVQNEMALNHSILTPMLNIGLLTPDEVLTKILHHAETTEISLNSLEGFVRQITGWREFIRGVYHYHGRIQRTQNFWQFSKKLPQCFYDGTTGILPFDQTIRKVLETGYCHHIERLMVLGNFMLLCEIDPDEVYRWFMELFIDAYDWVMVPNVYSMSQFADGGMMTTKPYISGSNYLKKMSDYPGGDWEQVWDGLFWRFMDKNRAFFLTNPRLGMLIKMFDKMPENKRLTHLKIAEDFLAKIFV